MSKKCLFLALTIVLATGAWGQSVIAVDTLAGADMGAKIANCVSVLTAASANGGICDARNFSGAQHDTSSPSTSTLFIGAANKPVELLLGAVTLTANRITKVQGGSSIVGFPAALGAGSIIKAAVGFGAGAVVELDGGANLLQDLVVDGDNQSTATSAIFVNLSGGVSMFRVVAQNATSHGILIFSHYSTSPTQPHDESCCAKLVQIRSISNKGTGLYSTNTADVFISLSEFEDNGLSGIELNDSPTYRIEHSDIGGNGRLHDPTNGGDGISIFGDGTGYSANGQIILGNQFGNNYGHDIQISDSSFNNLVSSNEFIGSSNPPDGPGRMSGADSIHILNDESNSGNNQIVGNTFYASSTPLHACINISGSSTARDQVVDNLCQAADVSGTTAIFATPGTYSAINREGSPYGIPPSGQLSSGRIIGNLVVTGSVAKSSGSFRIDHPLDPANKYLSHSFVESPEMMNIYNGEVTFGANGRAEVKLPDYFEALNQDFRYQLTPVGKYAPVYVIRKIKGNSFQIAGGKPGMEVSWQVSGIRHDSYANAHRVQVEGPKPQSERQEYVESGSRSPNP
jgi:hypothetical protein